MTWARVKMTLEKILTPRECPRCGQWMSEELLKDRHAERGRKISASNKGSERTGRPRSIDWGKAVEMRERGMSIQHIANELGASRGSVQHCFRTLGTKKGG